jgi:hypothetical protein
MCSPDNHTCNFMSHPFIEAVCWDQAPAKFQRVAKRWLRGRCFRSCVDHLDSNRGRVGKKSAETNRVSMPYIPWFRLSLKESDLFNGQLFLQQQVMRSH